MFNMPKPFRAEFRRDVVAVARKHEAPISQIAKDFGISEATLHNWLKRLVSLKYPLLRWVVVVYGGLGRGRGGSGFRLGVMARERDRRPRPVFQADPIEGIGGRK
jgi:hypothetical protein